MRNQLLPCFLLVILACFHLDPIGRFDHAFSSRRWSCFTSMWSNCDLLGGFDVYCRSNRRVDQVQREGRDCDPQMIRWGIARVAYSSALSSPIEGGRTISIQPVHYHILQIPETLLPTASRPSNSSRKDPLAWSVDISRTRLRWLNGLPFPLISRYTYRGRRRRRCRW